MDYKKYIVKTKFISERIHDHRLSDNHHISEYLENLLINTRKLGIRESLDSRELELDNEHKDLCNYEEPEEVYDIERIDYINSELVGLYEVKIIYLVKSLEISLKKALNATFNTKFDRSFNWSTLTQIFDFYKINFRGKEMGKLYNHITELRHVNNSSKHSYDEMSSDMLDIKEFSRNLKTSSQSEEMVVTRSRRITNLQYEDLKAFYRRVENSPLKWLDNIFNQLINYKYEFSNARLDRTAVDLALRMDKSMAEKLIAKLKIIYEISSK